MDETRKALAFLRGRMARANLIESGMGIVAERSPEWEAIKRVCDAYEELSMSDRKPTSIRLSSEADRLLDVLAKKLGLKRSAVMEMAIRKLAEQENADAST